MNYVAVFLAMAIALSAAHSNGQSSDPSRSGSVESQILVDKENYGFCSDDREYWVALDSIIDWSCDNQGLLFWLGLGSFVTFVVSLLSLPWLVALIPDDYFVPKKRHPAPWKDRNPAIRLLALILKNMLGCVLLIGGILMLFVPGQGVLTMMAGLLLLDYPGKFRLERKLATIPAILNGLNWLRGKANKPPLIV